jgi:ribonuclease J
MRELYGWLKPRIAIPVHGQPMHLAAHAGLARELGVEIVVEVEDGIMTRLAPDPVAQIDEIELKRLYKDGRLIADLEGIGVVERRRLSFAGHVTVAIVVNARGEVQDDPQVDLIGIARADANGQPMEETAMEAVLATLDSVPRPVRRDADALGEAVRRAVRAAVARTWGKKPVCTVFVSVV